MEEKKKITFRRLLLAKEIYLNGLGHSKSASSLDKMIAIHNFHNALEISLRAILLEYEIRSEKHLNIDFESMLNEIDSFKDFVEKKIKLPYRQELRNLNQLRNMVQHHAIEPESSTIDDWKVFSRRFLTKIFETYFKTSFDEVASVHFISEKNLKSLLLLAYDALKIEDFFQAIISSQLAFIFASYSVRELLPHDGFNSHFFTMSRLRSNLRDLPKQVTNAVDTTLRTIYEKIEESNLYSIYVSSGIPIVDYKNFERSTPHINLTLGGSYVIQTSPDYIPDKETASWVIGFVEQTIIKWQISGFDLKLRDDIETASISAISDIKSKIKIS